MKDLDFEQVHDKTANTACSSRTSGAEFNSRPGKVNYMIRV